MAVKISSILLSFSVSLGIAGCGDGLHTQDDEFVDGATDSSVADAQVDPATESCQGPQQLGCQSGEKCALLPPSFRCVADGTVLVGESCTLGAQGDDCSAGLHCYQGICNRLCGTETPCDEMDSCISISTEGERASICLPPCDPLAQDCPDLASGVRQGCYLHISGVSVCAVVSSNPPIFPGQSCQYLNQCAIGAGCVVVDNQSECRAYCDYENNTETSDPRCGPDDHCGQLGALASIGVCQ